MDRSSGAAVVGMKMVWIFGLNTVVLNASEWGSRAMFFVVPMAFHRLRASVEMYPLRCLIGGCRYRYSETSM